MGFNSGNGGNLVVGVITLHVKSFTHRRVSRLVENTHSGTAGFSNYEHTVYDCQWEADGPLDEDNLPDVDAGLAPGTSKATVTFKEGADSRTLVLTSTSVEELAVIVDNSADIVRWRATGRGGVLTNHTT